MPGDGVGFTPAFCAGVAFGLAVGAPVGVATEAMTVFGALLSTLGFDPDFSEPFGRAVFAAAFLAVVDELFSGLALALAGFDPGFVRAASRVLTFDPFAGTRAVPGALKTTSSLFARCSTCAVAPG